MHGGSSKKIKNWKWYQLNKFRTLHTSGGFCLPCMYQFESDLHPIEILWKKNTWYTEVKQMYECIAYELRAWLNMHEAQFI